MNRGKILVTCAQMQGEVESHRKRIERAGYRFDCPEISGQSFRAPELIRQMKGVVGLIAGDDELNADFFAASTDLRVVIRWGIGTDSVDTKAARNHGIVVRNTPGVFADEVADSAIAYALLCARRHHQIDAEVRRGGWPKVEGISLTGETLGLVGYGSIGQAVARRAAAFGMSVLAYDPYAAAPREATVTLCALEEVLERSRFLVLSCPLTSETKHLLNRETLALLPPNAYVINVARGSVIDETALVDALARGKLSGAGLDVFELEPPTDGNPLLQMDSVILGAHNGSNTRAGVRRASERAVQYLLEELGNA